MASEAFQLPRASPWGVEPQTGPGLVPGASSVLRPWPVVGGEAMRGMASRTEWALKVRQSLGGGLHALDNGRMALASPSCCMVTTRGHVRAIAALCRLRLCSQCPRLGSDPGFKPLIWGTGFFHIYLFAWKKLCLAGLAHWIVSACRTVVTGN